MAGGYEEAAQFRSALRRFLRRSEEISRRHGLTPRQYLVLLMIKGEPRGRQTATVGELVERLALTQSTVTELVQRAEDVGLLLRDRDPTDGRVAFIRLSEKGERLLEAAFEELGPERESLLAVLRQV